MIPKIPFSSTIIAEVVCYASNHKNVFFFELILVYEHCCRLYRIMPSLAAADLSNRRSSSALKKLKWKLLFFLNEVSGGRLDISSSGNLASRSRSPRKRARLLLADSSLENSIYQDLPVSRSFLCIFCEPIVSWTKKTLNPIPQLEPKKSRLPPRTKASLQFLDEISDDDEKSNLDRSDDRGHLINEVDTEGTPLKRRRTFSPNIRTAKIKEPLS